LLLYCGSNELRERFKKIIEQKIQDDGKIYLKVIKGLTSKQADIGTKWMESIVQRVSAESLTNFPSLEK